MAVLDYMITRLHDYMMNNNICNHQSLSSQVEHNIWDYMNNGLNNYMYLDLFGAHLFLSL